jgi:hypothetical protein
MKTLLISLSFSGNGLPYSFRDISDVLNFLKLRNEKYNFHAYREKNGGKTHFFADGELSDEEVEYLVSEIRLTRLSVIWSNWGNRKPKFAEKIAIQELEETASIKFDAHSFVIL